MKIKIKENIYKEIEKRIKKSGEFSSVEEYVNFFLKKLLFEEEKRSDQEEEKLIKERLKDLGYT